MKIINTIKKYFNDETKENFSTTSTDNVYEKLNNDMLDLKIKEIDNMLQALVNFTEVKQYTINTSNNEYVGGTAFNMSISNNIVYFSGRLVSKQALQGEVILDLPIDVPPLIEYTGIRTIVLESGNEYRIQVIIEQDHPNKMKLFFYDTFPQGIGLVINFSYPIKSLMR